MSRTEHVGLSMPQKDAVAVVDKKSEVKNYKGFLAGVFSGITKLTGK